jgi:hypothetical protein
MHTAMETKMGTVCIDMMAYRLILSIEIILNARMTRSPFHSSMAFTTRAQAAARLKRL